MTDKERIERLERLVELLFKILQEKEGNKSTNV